MMCFTNLVSAVPEQKLHPLCGFHGDIAVRKKDPGTLIRQVIYLSATANIEWAGASFQALGINISKVFPNGFKTSQVQGRLSFSSFQSFSSTGKKEVTSSSKYLYTNPSVVLRREEYLRVARAAKVAYQG